MICFAVIMLLVAVAAVAALLYVSNMIEIDDRDNDNNQE